MVGFGGRFLGRHGASILTIGCLSISTLLAGLAFARIGLHKEVCVVDCFPWIHSGALQMNWGFLFDSLTVTMLLTVSVVATLVHIYSVGYMSNDPHQPRFMAYLSLFTFFMFILVSADNYIQMFVGWEGVGLCSYLLIGFWQSRIQANKAAIKAIVVNRIGDFGFILAIGAIYMVFRSVHFETIFATLPYFSGSGFETFIVLNKEFSTLGVICILLFIGAMAKSAQIGLHTWLPDAMEGPTPVSALIHAATMVTAGVFMIIRSSPLFEHAPQVLSIVTLVGALTAFFAATTGLVQNDLKKVIAYSTCSQLGYMIFACGISNYTVSIFHLMNHAFFKALLFLGAGCVIHALGDEQDMRRMGALVKFIPLTYIMMVIGSLSLMGFPFLTGFYSKDVILEVAYAKYTMSGHFAYWLGIVSAFFTAFYSFRLLYLTFLNEANASRKDMEHVHDAPFSMAFPLLILALGSVFIGYLAKDMMIGLGTDFWGNSIYIASDNLSAVDSEFIPLCVKWAPVLLSLAGAIIALVSYSFFSSRFAAVARTRGFRSIYHFLSRKWYFDLIYNELVVRPVLFFGYHISFKVIDRGLIEIFGPYGLSASIGRSAKILSSLQTGFVYNYAFVMVLGVIALLAVVTQWLPVILDLRLIGLLFLALFFLLSKRHNLTKYME